MKTTLELADYTSFANGEVVCEYVGDFDLDDWRLHPQGVLIRVHGRYVQGQGHEPWKILLNNQTILPEKDFHRWSYQPDYKIIVEGDRLLLNGQLLYQGAWNRWFPHPQGVVIWTGDKLLLNGKELLFQSRCRGMLAGYKYNAQVRFDDGVYYVGGYRAIANTIRGIIIENGDKLLLNGQVLLYEGKWNRWDAHPHGVIVENGNRWVADGRGPRHVKFRFFGIG